MSEDTRPVPVVELEASQLELVVSEKTIGHLTTNAKQIKELVEEALPRYDIANYSTDDVAKAKADKALLNKAAKTLNDKRIEFEREFMAPFGEFKEVVTETVKLIKEAVGKIDVVIKEDEERYRSEKRDAIEHIAEECGVEEVGIMLERIWSDKWLNKGTSLKSVEKEISEKVANIKSDLETLKTFSEDYDVLVVRYKENLDLKETVCYANVLKEQREARIKAEEAKRKAEEEEKAQAEAEAKAKEEPEPQTQEKAEEEDPFAAFEKKEEEPEKPQTIEQPVNDDIDDAFANVLGEEVSQAQPEPRKHQCLYLVTAISEELSKLEEYMQSQGLMYTIKEE